MKGTGGGEDPGIVRLDRSGLLREGRLKPISWNELFAKLEENELAFLYQDETAGGELALQQAREALLGRAARR